MSNLPLSYRLIRRSHGLRLSAQYIPRIHELRRKSCPKCSISFEAFVDDDDAGEPGTPRPGAQDTPQEKEASDQGDSDAGASADEEGPAATAAAGEIAAELPPTEATVVTPPS